MLKLRTIRGIVSSILISGMALSAMAAHTEGKPVYNETADVSYDNLVDAWDSAADGDVILLYANQELTKCLTSKITVDSEDVTRSLTVKSATDTPVVLTRSNSKNMFFLSNSANCTVTLENLILDGQYEIPNANLTEVSGWGSKMMLNNVTVRNAGSSNRLGLIVAKGGGQLRLNNLSCENCLVNYGLGEVFLGANGTEISGSANYDITVEKQYTFKVGADGLKPIRPIGLYSYDNTFANGNKIVENCTDPTQFRVVKAGFELTVNGSNLCLAEGDTPQYTAKGYTGIMTAWKADNWVAGKSWNGQPTSTANIDGDQITLGLTTSNSVGNYYGALYNKVPVTMRENLDYALVKLIPAEGVTVTKVGPKVMYIKETDGVKAYWEPAGAFTTFEADGAIYAYYPMIEGFSAASGNQATYPFKIVGDPEGNYNNYDGGCFYGVGVDATSEDESASVVIEKILSVSLADIKFGDKINNIRIRKLLDANIEVLGDMPEAEEPVEPEVPDEPIEPEGPELIGEDTLKWGYLTYTILSETELAVKECEDVAVDIEVPATVRYGDNVYNVVEIGEKAFYQKKTITGLTLPEGIRKIGFYSLGSTTAMEKLNIPSTVKEIDRWALNGCGAKNPLEFPAGLESIGEYTFGACKSETIDLSKCTLLTIIPKNCFKNCKSTNVYLPNSIVTLDEGCFSYCDLKYLKLPESLRNINEDAFKGSQSFEEIEIPEGVEEIGDAAFYINGSRKVTLPSTIKKIGDSTFSGMKRIMEVVCKAEKVPEGPTYPFPDRGNDFAFTSIPYMILRIPHSGYTNYVSTKGWCHDRFQHIYCLEDEDELDHVEVTDIEGYVVEHEGVLASQEDISFTIDFHKTINTNVAKVTIEKYKEPSPTVIQNSSLFTDENDEDESIEPKELTAGVNKIDLNDLLTKNIPYVVTTSVYSADDDETPVMTHSFTVLKYNSDFTGVSDVNEDSSAFSTEATIYDLQGRCVGTLAGINRLTPGVYVVKENGRAAKFIR